MQLRCRRCRQLIKPDEPMVVVEVERPQEWSKPAQVAERLAHAPGRWHYRCAPIPVRQYATSVA